VLYKWEIWSLVLQGRTNWNRVLWRELEYKGHEAMGGWIIVRSYVTCRYLAPVITTET